jgi:hypothetical protein
MRETPPAWFNARIDQAPSWATDVPVTPAAIDGLARLWAAPETRPTMVQLWNAFRASEVHFRRALPQVGTARLKEISPWELVHYLVTALGVDQGITTCTPDLPDLPRRDKAVLYYQAMLMGFLGNAFRHRVPPPRAVEWAVMKALGGAACYAMGPLVVAEIRQRGTAHPGGYGVSMLELLRRAEHLAPIFGQPDARIADGLIQEARNRAASLLKRSGLRRPARGRTRSVFEDFREGMPGQAVITAAKHWGAVNLFELLARSLAGELDHAGQAIAGDVADAARSRAWRTIELHFTEDGASQLPDRAGRGRLLDLERRASADPELHRYLEAASDGADRKTVARRLGRSVRYVANYRARLKKLAEDLPP